MNKAEKLKATPSNVLTITSVLGCTICFLIMMKSQWEFYNSEPTGTSLQWKSVKNIPLNDWLATMDQYHISFLEINPYIITDAGCQALDMAAEIDSTKANRLPGWAQDHILYKKVSNKAEEEVLEQDARTQAALNLHTLNPNGSILTLLSGGGASPARTILCLLISRANQAGYRSYKRDDGRSGSYNGGKGARLFRCRAG